MELNSLNFAVKRILFKIFRTNSNDIVQSCQLYFNFPDMSVLLTARKKKFLTKFSVSDYCLCTLFNSTALTDLAYNNWFVNGSSLQQLIQLVQYAEYTCNLFIYLFMYFLSSFIIVVVQLLCVIVCRASVNEDVNNTASAWFYFIGLIIYQLFINWRTDKDEINNKLTEAWLYLSQIND